LKDRVEIKKQNDAGRQLFVGNVRHDPKANPTPTLTLILILTLTLTLTPTPTPTPPPSPLTLFSVYYSFPSTPSGKNLRIYLPRLALSFALKCLLATTADPRAAVPSCSKPKPTPSAPLVRLLPPVLLRNLWLKPLFLEVYNDYDFQGRKLVVREDKFL